MIEAMLWGFGLVVGLFLGVVFIWLCYRFTRIVLWVVGASLLLLILATATIALYLIYPESFVRHAGPAVFCISLVLSLLWRNRHDIFTLRKPPYSIREIEHVPDRPGPGLGPEWWIGKNDVLPRARRCRRRAVCAL
jgi:hypothetical protein